MCGIAGVLSWDAPPDAAAVRAMTAALAHRGPDGEGFFGCGPIALGHRRLAIIDLTDAGRQPMSDIDGRCAVVFNGEIYNFTELRRTLESDGARFRSRSDTEVILEAYKRWDVGCLAHLNGMFAFAVWDAPRQRLFVARDRAGEKPVFFQALPSGVAFASELRALRRHPAVSRELNPAALGQLLSLNYVVDPDCIVSGVRKLQPAHYLLVERGQPIQEVRYWSLADAFRRKASYASAGEAADALDALFTEAVRARLISDVPLGAFLSGGIDSSSVVAAMARIGSAHATKTFSIGFDEATYDESADARSAAAAIGVDHASEIVRGADAALPEVVAACDEPLADTSAIPMYLLARFARRSVTVCLSGDGGDETFAGYETYRADALRHMTRWVPVAVTRAAASAAAAVMPVTFDKVGLDFKLRQFARGHDAAPSRAHYAWRQIFSDSEKAALLRPDARTAVLSADPFGAFERHYAEVADLAPLDRFLYVDAKTWLASDILVKVDRMTMAHSLESRAPFLDHRVMEFAASLPPAWKLHGLTTKYLLKKTQQRHLPPSIVRRRKQGFNAPISHWLAGPLHDSAREATSPRVLGEWFDADSIDRLWDEHRRAQADHGLKLFGLTALGLWLTHRS